MAHKHCTQLGMLCQSRRPPCRGESCHRQHYFAPGVIDGKARRKRGPVERISFCVLVLAGLAAFSAVFGFALGYVNMGVL